MSLKLVKKSYQASDCHINLQCFKSLSLTITSCLLCIVALSPPIAVAKIGHARALPPIIYLLLLDDQCPSVTSATTIPIDTPITSQAELNELKGATRIDGMLEFNDVALETLDFSPLDSLIEIEGSILFNTPALTSIDGFDCLTSISGNLTIIDIDFLMSISGFAILNSIGGNLEIRSNDELTSISGFQTLLSTDVIGDIDVNENARLDCSNPEPNFVPVTSSIDNLVDCAL